MTGKFWSSFFYETTLYNLLVKRKNIYLEQKKKLLDTSVYNNTNKLKNNNDTQNSGNDLKMNNNIIINSNYTLKKKKNKRCEYLYILLYLVYE